MSKYKVCRNQTFYGTMWDRFVPGRQRVPTENMAYMTELCVEVEDEDEAPAKLDREAEHWCKRPSGLTDREFECKKVGEKGPLRVTQTESIWDGFFKFFREL